ncbi:hypothetical protein RFI_14278, partial [Reticulomyxa filosa]
MYICIYVYNNKEISIPNLYGRTPCITYWDKWLYLIALDGPYSTIESWRIQMNGRETIGQWIPWGQTTQFSSSAKGSFVCQSHGKSVYIIQTTDLEIAKTSAPQTFTHGITTQILAFDMETGDIQPTGVSFQVDRMYASSAIANNHLYILNGFVKSISNIKTVNNTIEYSNTIHTNNISPTNELYLKCIVNSASQIYVNGEKAMTTDDPKMWYSKQVSVISGNNVIAINATSKGSGHGAFMCYWSVSHANIFGVSDTTWKYYISPDGMWTLANYSDDSWSNV